MRNALDRPKLARLLGGWPATPAEGPAPDVAERLGRWLGAFDAVGLQAGHQAIRSIHTAAARKPGEARAPGADALTGDLQRVRATLAHAIAQDPVAFAIPKLARNLSQQDAASLPTVVDAGYAPYQQRHQKLQRQMEQLVAPLRDHVRQAVSQVSARLRQLAALDAVLEQVLAPREQAHLPTVSLLLQRRFDALRRTQDDDAAAADWRGQFRREWTQALLAELDLHLEPVAGLIEALAED